MCVGVAVGNALPHVVVPHEAVQSCRQRVDLILNGLHISQFTIKSVKKKILGQNPLR